METIYVKETGPRNTLAPWRDRKGELHVGPLWIAGRLDGLAGTTRYNLNDEDRELLKMASAVIRYAAERLKNGA